MANLHNALAIFVRDQGDVAAARPLFDESIRLYAARTGPRSLGARPAQRAEADSAIASDEAS